jgi:hypothetical protein
MVDLQGRGENVARDGDVYASPISYALTKQKSSQAPTVQLTKIGSKFSSMNHLQIRNPWLHEIQNCSLVDHEPAESSKRGRDYIHIRNFYPT